MDDLNLLRIAITLASFVAFIGIVVHALRAANAPSFAEAAALPFAEGAGAAAAQTKGEALR